MFCAIVGEFMSFVFFFSLFFFFLPLGLSRNSVVPKLDCLFFFNLDGFTVLASLTLFKKKRLMSTSLINLLVKLFICTIKIRNMTH